MPNSLIIRERCFEWGKRTYIMGVLNVTPDSFSDGGTFVTVTSALAQAKVLETAGADIIDVGGQSTRPGAEQISLAEELDRVIPVIEAISKETTIPISVDTTRAEVAASAVNVGANIVNDISSGTFDPEMFTTVAKLKVPIVLMHIRGNPQTMQQFTDYKDLMGEISSFLNEQVAKASAAGIDYQKIILDPGIGFAKNYEQNLEIFRRLSELRSSVRAACNLRLGSSASPSLDLPILVGPSRKSFIGRILNEPDPKARVWGTAAACCAAILNGADILRVHDVKEMRDVSMVFDALYR